MLKSGYESIPDADVGTDADEGGLSSAQKQAARTKYSDFDCREAEVLGSLDHVISNQPSFSFPSLNSADLSVANGQKFVLGLVRPSLTAAFTSLTALALGASAQTPSTLATIAAVLIPLFPYLNAISVFVGSFLPMYKRLMESVIPIFDKIETTQRGAESNMDDLSAKVDRVLDNIQKQVHHVLEPYQTIFAKASRSEAVLQKMKPDIDIPDPSDIDREFDQAQGSLQQKIQEAKGSIDIRKAVPSILSSSKAFFWWIVVPVGVLSLAVQLAVVAATTPPGASGLSSLPFAFNTSGYLSSHPAVLNSQIMGVSSLTNDTDKGESRRLLRGTSNNVDDIVEFDDAPGLESSFPQNGSDIASFSAPGWNGTNITSLVDSLHDRLEVFESFDIDSMLCNVAVSYVVAFLQLALSYLLTSDKVKAWLVKVTLSVATAVVKSKLRELGVQDQLDDVFVRRMGNVRTKLLKTLESGKELEKLMGTTPGGAMGGEDKWCC